MAGCAASCGRPSKRTAPSFSSKAEETVVQAPLPKRRRLRKGPPVVAEGSAALSDYYAALGVEIGADQSQLRSAYRRRVLSKDVVGKPSELRRLIEAFEALSDQFRARQDESLPAQGRVAGAIGATARVALDALLTAGPLLRQRLLCALLPKILEALLVLLPRMSRNRCRLTCRRCLSQAHCVAASARSTEAPSPEARKRGQKARAEPGIFRVGAGFVAKVKWRDFLCKTSSPTCLCQAVDWHVALCQLRSVAVARLEKAAADADPLVAEDISSVLDDMPAQSPVHLLFCAGPRSDGTFRTPWSHDYPRVMRDRRQLSQLMATGAQCREVKIAKKRLILEAHKARAARSAAERGLKREVLAELQVRRGSHYAAAASRAPANIIASFPAMGEDPSAPGTPDGQPRTPRNRLGDARPAFSSSPARRAPGSLLALQGNREDASLRAGASPKKAFAVREAKVWLEELAHAKEAVSSVFEYLDAVDVFRVAATSLAASEAGWEDIGARFKHFEFHKDFFRGRPTRAGRVRHPLHGELVKRLLTFFAGDTLRHCFVRLDLRLAPPELLEDARISAVLKRMPNLVYVSYPRYGWSGAAAMRSFEAAIPDGVLGEARDQNDH